MYETMLLVCICGHTNGVYNRSIRSNREENLFLNINKKNVQTLKLTDSVAQRDLRTS